MKLKLTLLIVAALLINVGAARAQEHESRHAKSPAAKTAPVKSSSVQLGDKTIFIPDPEGFEEGTSQFDTFKQRVVTTEAPQNDVLVAHLPVADCELVRRGLPPSYDTYSKVSVMKIAREMTITRADMTPIVTGFRANLGAYLDPSGSTMKELDKHLERGLSQLNAQETKVDFGKPQFLGEFDIRPDANGFLILITLKSTSNGVEQVMPMLTTTSFVRVKDRVVFVYFFRKYRSQADIDTIKQLATKWTTSILAANQ